MNARAIIAAGALLAFAPAHAGTSCAALGVTHNSDSGGYVGERFDWRDASCAPRSALMVYNDRADPAGHRGGYLRWYDYVLSNGTTRHVQGSFDGHPGWGYTVNHYGNTGHVGYSTNGSWQLLFQGRHHAILRYTRRIPLPGPVDTTIDWLFATGRDNPVWAVTYDASPAGPNAVNADTRAPYGDLQWDGGANVDVDGVGWGDRYKFRSTTAPVTLQSGWDYSQPNTVPYVQEWSTAADAEMGAVQTQTMAQHDAGGYWFYSAWGTSDADGPMPVDWNWTYQLNQYEIPFTLKSKRLAWGANYGAIGQVSYNAYGDGATRSGYPYHSYAVHMVLGQRTANPTLAQVTQVERTQALAVSASVGSVRTSGPAGAGRPDTAAWQPAGYNPAYGTFEVNADAGRATFTLTPTAGAVRNPIVVVDGYAAASASITFDGVAAVADVDYFASFDPASQRLWLTLKRDVAAPLTVAVGSFEGLFGDGFE